MITFLMQNLATILISGFLLAVVVLISAHLIRSKRSGKSVGCGCGCSECPSASLCHKG